MRRTICWFLFCPTTDDQSHKHIQTDHTPLILPSNSIRLSWALRAGLSGLPCALSPRSSPPRTLTITPRVTSVYSLLAYLHQTPPSFFILLSSKHFILPYLNSPPTATPHSILIPDSHDMGTDHLGLAIIPHRLGPERAVPGCHLCRHSIIPSSHYS